MSINIVKDFEKSNVDERLDSEGVGYKMLMRNYTLKALDTKC